MTLSSRHRIRNSSPGGLRPSTLPPGHSGSPQYWVLHVDGEETFLFLSNRRDREPNPGQIWVILIEKTDKFINSKSCRNRKLSVNVQQKYRKDVVLAVIFCFAYLKVKETKGRMLPDRFQLSTLKLCKKKAKKNSLKCRAKLNVSYFSPG